MKKLLVLSLVLACGQDPVLFHPASQMAPPPASPADLPPMTTLASAEVPAPPAIDSYCPASAPGAASHHPGPCQILISRSDPKDLYRTTRVYNDAGLVVSERNDHWIGWPDGTFGGYQRTTITRSLAGNGRPLRQVWLVQGVYGADAKGSSVSAGIADFSYDSAGHVSASNATVWPEHFGNQNSYLVDALGKIFLVHQEGTYQHDRTFLVYPNGAVSSYSETSAQMGNTAMNRQLYDEEGRLLEQVRSDTDRFSHTTTSSAKYQYDGDRIVSIDTESGFWASKPAGIDLGEGIISRVDASNYYAGTPSAGHTVYRYDTSGNNVERVTTDPSGNVTARYLAVYDTAKNLICEQNTRAGLPDSVIHYDYSCF